MYKFEISADSPQELREKMLEFANEIRETMKQDETDEYVNEPVEVPTFVEPMKIPHAGPTIIETQGIHIELKKPEPLLDLATGALPKATPEIDSKGVIYDPAIHSANKSTNKDGTWRLRRGVDKSAIQQTVAKPEPFVAPPPPAPTMVVPVVTHHQPGPIEANQPVGLPEMTTITAVPVAMPPTVDFSKPEPFLPPQAPEATPMYDMVQVPSGVRSAHTLATFKNNLPMIFANLINEKKINQEYIEQLKKHFGVKEVWNIMGNEKQALELYQFFGELGFITRVD